LQVQIWEFLAPTLVGPIGRAPPRRGGARGLGAPPCGQGGDGPANGNATGGGPCPNRLVISFQTILLILVSAIPN
jgi:hypothetical protein